MIKLKTWAIRFTMAADEKQLNTTVTNLYVHAGDKPPPAVAEQNDYPNMQSAVEEPVENAPVLPSETAHGSGSPHPGETSEQALSKSRLQKLKRKQIWEDGRESRKQRRREKRHAKQEQKREAREALNANLTNEGTVATESLKPRIRSVQLPITILLDCGFDHLMEDKERISLASQITRCYSDNNHASFRAHLALSSFNGKLRERYETVLANQYRSWKGVRFLEDDFTQVAAASKRWMADPEKGGRLAGAFAHDDELSTPEATEDDNDEAHKFGNEDSPSTNHETTTSSYDSQAVGETVYLTSESPETLRSLKPHGTYVIGGLVDRNRHKGICFKRAMDHGIRTAKLPIAEHLDMSSRFVLTTNHVNEIMLAWLASGDWGAALERVMPKRKGAVPKGKGDTATSQAGSEDRNEAAPQASQDEEVALDEETFKERSMWLE